MHSFRLSLVSMEERMTLTNPQIPKMARLKIPERRNECTRQATKNRWWYRVIRVPTTSILVTGADWHWRSDRHGAMSNVALTLTRSRHGEEYLPHSGASARAVLLTYRWSTVSGRNLSHKILDLFFKRKPFSLTRVGFSNFSNPRKRNRWQDEPRHDGYRSW